MSTLWESNLRTWKRKSVRLRSIRTIKVQGKNIKTKTIQQTFLSFVFYVFSVVHKYLRARRSISDIRINLIGMLYLTVNLDDDNNGIYYPGQTIHGETLILFPYQCCYTYNIHSTHKQALLAPVSIKLNQDKKINGRYKF